MSLHNFSEYPLFMKVSVCECERGKKRSTTSILQCEILSLRAGRFVDAKEGKSECKLCERGGFITIMWLGKCELLSCSIPGGKYLRVMCLKKLERLFQKLDEVPQDLYTLFDRLIWWQKSGMMQTMLLITNS